MFRGRFQAPIPHTNNLCRCRITTPQLNYVGSVCVRFYYHMYGNDMGELRVYRQSGGNYSTSHSDIWSTSGNKGSDWHKELVEVELTGNEDRVSVAICTMLHLYYLRSMANYCITLYTKVSKRLYHHVIRIAQLVYIWNKCSIKDY